MNNKNVVKENNDGYEVSRTYKLKKSTMKKLYQIKANEDDFTVKFNAILNDAIICYYNNIFNK